jgi:hypothetical protein
VLRNTIGKRKYPVAEGYTNVFIHIQEPLSPFVLKDINEVILKDLVNNTAQNFGHGYTLCACLLDMEF